MASRPRNHLRSGGIEKLASAASIETTAVDEIKTHYYTTHDHLNPKHTIPRGPLGWDLTSAHGRG